MNRLSWFESFFENRLDMPSQHHKNLLILAGHIFYFFCGVIVFPYLGDLFLLLAFVPLVLSAWFYRYYGGILSALTLFILDLFFTLLNSFGTASQVLILFGNLAGMLFIGLLVGLCRSFKDRLNTEIQQRYRTQERLQMLETVIGHTPTGVLLLNPQPSGLSILYINQAFEQITGYSRREVLGRKIFNFPGLKTDPETIAQMRLAIETGAAFQETLLCTRKNGAAYWNQFSLTPVFESQGKITSYLGTVTDVTAQKIIEEQLRIASTHDTLTGLFNRAYFEIELMQAEKQQHFPFTVIVADMDGLKEVNDRLGHPTGDEVLRQVAQILHKSLRPGDIAARIGGDEFYLLLARADEAQTQTIVSQIQSQISVYNLVNPLRPIGVSIGFATVNNREEASCAIQLADQRMYAEKRLHHQKISEN